MQAGSILAFIEDPGPVIRRFNVDYLSFGQCESQRERASPAYATSLLRRILQH